MRRSHPRRSGFTGHRAGGYITGTADTKDVDRLLRQLSQGKEGRKLIRRASQVSLEYFNEKTYENASQLPLNKSGKNWRKTLKKKGSFKYRSKMSGGRFHFWTGVVYKGILKVSHLVERGFTHVNGAKVAGNWYRKKAFEQNRNHVMFKFKRYMERGMDMLYTSGKAPTLRDLRNLTQ